MIEFEREFFRKVSFPAEDIRKLLDNARRDLAIAQKDPFPEVQFSYSFQALIKAGIALIAKVGSVKVRSIPGHHVKILEKMSVLLKDTDVYKIGDAMRTRRNTDFYSGGTPVSENEAKDYLRFAQGVIRKVEQAIR